jgi:hypothetical protein
MGIIGGIRTKVLATPKKIKIDLRDERENQLFLVMSPDGHKYLYARIKNWTKLNLRTLHDFRRTFSAVLFYWKKK